MNKWLWSMTSVSLKLRYADIRSFDRLSQLKPTIAEAHNTLLNTDRPTSTIL